MNEPSFSYGTLLADVVFGEGTVDRLPAELDRLGFRRVLLLTGPSGRLHVERLKALLGERLAGTFEEARMHVPVEIAARGVARAIALSADAVVAFGGGSPIGLGKAIALETGLPQVVVDTTYAGSSRTPIWGMTEGGRKKTGNDPRVLPRLVIYDPRLTYSLSPRTTAASGMNAIAHCVEALYSAQRNPVTDLLAERGIFELGWAIPRAVREATDVEARRRALLGAFLAGTALGSVGMALHHKLCHALGGGFDLPHAETHAVILPHVVRFNEPFAGGAIAATARALGVADAAAGLFDLLTVTGLPRSLAELGLAEDSLDRAADLATQNPYFNPRPVDRPAVRVLLEDAFRGRLAARGASG